MACLHLCLLINKHSPLNGNEDGQSQANNRSETSQGSVDGDRIPIQGPMCERIKPRLGEVDESRKTSDSSVDAPKCGEPEDLCSVITGE